MRRHRQRSVGRECMEQADIGRRSAHADDQQWPESAKDVERRGAMDASDHDASAWRKIDMSMTTASSTEGRRKSGDRRASPTRRHARAIALMIAIWRCRPLTKETGCLAKSKSMDTPLIFVRMMGVNLAAHEARETTSHAQRLSGCQDPRPNPERCPEADAARRGARGIADSSLPSSQATVTPHGSKATLP